MKVDDSKDLMPFKQKPLQKLDGGSLGVPNDPWECVGIPEESRGIPKESLGNARDDYSILMALFCYGSHTTLGPKKEPVQPTTESFH